MIRNSVVGWTVCTLACFTVVAAWAQQQQEGAAELYGRGVSAYFSGDAAAAIVYLDKAIKANPNDPREFFFRGLARALQSGMDAAKADFAKASEIEANAGTHVYDVDDALQRIQGPLRSEIEAQRHAARQAAAALKRKQKQVRYEQISRAEKTVLFDPQQPAPKIDFPIAKPDVKLDPFTSGMALTGGKQVAVTATSTPAATTSSTEPAPRDPFAAPAGGTAVKPEDPFAPAPASGAELPPASKAPPTNPFGDMAPSVPQTPEPAKTDAGTSAAPAADPFGIGTSGPTKAAPTGVDEPATAAEPPADVTGSASPIGGAVGSVLGLMGKTLSGKGTARDPFGAPADPATEKPAETTKSNEDDPFATGPAPKTDSEAKPPAPKKPTPPPADDPFK